MVSRTNAASPSAPLRKSTGLAATITRTAPVGPIACHLSMLAAPLSRSLPGSNSRRRKSWRLFRRPASHNSPSRHELGDGAFYRQLQSGSRRFIPDRDRWRARHGSGNDGAPEGRKHTGVQNPRTIQSQSAVTEWASPLPSRLAAGRMGTCETDLVAKTRLWTPEGMALFEINLPGGRGHVGGAQDEYWAALHPDDRHLMRKIPRACRQPRFVYV